MQAYGMFVFNEETRTYWFSNASMEAGTEFRLVGQLMGLAIFNSVILDAHFPHCLYLKLLGKKPSFAVSPCFVCGSMPLLTAAVLSRQGASQTLQHALLFVQWLGSTFHPQRK